MIQSAYSKLERESENQRISMRTSLEVLISLDPIITTSIKQSTDEQIRETENGIKKERETCTELTSLAILSFSS